MPWIWGSVGIGENLLKVLLLGRFGSRAVTTFCLGLVLSLDLSIDLRGDLQPHQTSVVWAGGSFAHSLLSSQVAPEPL